MVAALHATPALAAAQNLLGVAPTGFGGTVIDANGRPLPLVSVTVYGDTMALEEQWTDRLGQFYFEPMVAAVSQWVRVNSAGFRSRISRVNPGDTTVTIRLTPTQSIGNGLGLAREVDVVVGLADGGVLQIGDTVCVGEKVLVTVTSHGTGSCTRAGPVMREMVDNELFLLVGDYHEAGVCHLSRTSHPRTIDHVFGHPGEGVIRVIAYRGEQVLRFPVSPSRRPDGGRP